jgi:hypothetical protein
MAQDGAGELREEALDEVEPEAKREIAVAEIAEKLGTKLRRKARGSRNCFQRAATIASILLTRQSPWSHIRQSSVGDFLNLAARMKF